MRNQWDRTLAIGLGLAGIFAIYLGWRGVSGALLPSQQIPYLASGGIFGLFLLGAGATLWLSSDLRDEWRKIDSLSDDIRSVGDKLDAHQLTTAVNGTSPAPRRRNAPLRSDAH